MAPQKNREYEHHGITFKVIPGSARERLLLDMFQAHDSAARKPGIIEPGEADGGWLFPLSTGLVSGFMVGFGIGWLI